MIETQELVEQLRKKLLELDAAKAAIDEQIAPIEARADKAHMKVTAAAEAWKAIRQEVVALEESSGLRELCRERGKIARALAALDAGKVITADTGTIP
jgi:predicted  nucleic acid-binding Zn-ribbon protein